MAPDRTASPRRKPARAQKPEKPPAEAPVARPGPAPVRAKKSRAPSDAPAPSPEPGRTKKPGPGPARKPKEKRPVPPQVEAGALPPVLEEDDLGLPVVTPPPTGPEEPLLEEVAPAAESDAREFLSEVSSSQATRQAGAPGAVEPQVEATFEPPSPSRAGARALARQLVEQSLRSDAVGKVLGAARGMFQALKTGLGASGSRQVDDYGKDAELVQALSPIAGFLYERYWRVSAQGAELIPEGPSILVANHSGALPFDGPILAQALARQRPDLPEARWLVEDQIFNAPFLGTVFNRLGAVRACPENALRLLSEGRPVIVFPEGAQGTGKSFGQRYQLKRLGRGGFAKLAVRAGVPLVPVAVVGAEEALPLLGRLPLRSFGLPDLPITPGPLPVRWYIRFGEPIPTNGLAPGAAEKPAEIMPLVERTRAAIEEMIQALLEQRRSAFGG